MSETIEKLVGRMEEQVLLWQEEFCEEMLYKLEDELERGGYGLSAVGPLLRLMERHPEADFGSPGGLVHYIEAQPGYEPLLYESLRRAPAEHTVWMLGRILNASQGFAWEEGIALLREICGREDVPQTVRESAGDFLEFQLGERAPRS